MADESSGLRLFLAKPDGQHPGAAGLAEVSLSIVSDDSVGDVVPGLEAADVIGGWVTSDLTTITIALRFAAGITDEYQYRVKLTTDLGVAYHLKWSDGTLTGLDGLYVDPDPPFGFTELRFIFDRAAITAIGSFEWLGQTQAGVKATEANGIVDNMPDSGTFVHVMP